MDPRVDFATILQLLYCLLVLNSVISQKGFNLNNFYDTGLCQCVIQLTDNIESLYMFVNHMIQKPNVLTKNIMNNIRITGMKRKIGILIIKYYKNYAIEYCNLFNCYNI